MATQIPEHTVTYTTRDGEDVAVVELRRSYPGTAEDVWGALTDPERLPRWFAPVSGELRLGGRYQVEGNAGGTVLACDPPRSFALTWEFAGATSWVDVEVTPDGDDRSSVRLRHTCGVDNDHWRQFGPAAVGIGWDLATRGLDLHLSTGASLDPGTEETWTLGPEGTAWVGECGEAWYRADVTAGASDGEARSRVDACVTFFTVLPEEAPAGGQAQGGPA